MSERMTIDELKSYLWQSAVLLRTNIDAGAYKQYIFPLMFTMKKPKRRSRNTVTILTSIQNKNCIHSSSRRDTIGTTCAR